MSTMTLYSDPEDMKDKWDNNPWSFMPFFSADDAAQTWLDWNLAIDDDTLPRRHIAVRVPSFITWADDTVEIDDPASSVVVSMEMPSSSNDGTYKECKRIIPPAYNSASASGWFGLTSGIDPALTGSAWAACTNADPCCYMYEPNSRILKVGYDYGTIQGSNSSTHWTTGTPNAYENGVRGIKVDFIAPGTAAWEQKYITTQAVDDVTSTLALGTTTSDIIEHRRSAEPGNALYYLNRLAKLELIGIPQITFEPLYCNDNYQKIVPGIFKTSVDGQPLTNVVEFNNHDKTFLDDNSKKPWQSDLIPNALLDADSLNEPYVATSELLSHEKIFSDHDFMCCAPLGSKLQDGESMTKCCSGYAIEDDNGDNAPKTYSCMLPPATNLNVYFNKFVSSEGTSSSLDNPLVESDFDSRTGAPKLSATSKLQELAQQFCAPNFEFVRGGAFGPFVAQPRGNLGISGSDEENSPYSIVDSQFDIGDNNNSRAGYLEFSNGFRWNHNVYCAGSTAN